MEQQQTTAQKVLETIETKQVTPIAKWHFVFKNTSFWLLWSTSVVLGACATAAMIFVFLNSGWKYHSITHDSFLKFLLDVVPLFWILTLLGMVAFGYYNIRHTKKGYRFSFYLVVFASVIASGLGGVILYALGIGGDIDDFRRPLPFSNPIISTEELYWNNEDRGLLSGFVITVDTKAETMILATLPGKTESVVTSELLPEEHALLISGAHVRIIGSRGVNNTFVACAVIPLDLPKKMLSEDKLTERKEQLLRNNVCKDARPYLRYRQIFITK